MLQLNSFIDFSVINNLRKRTSNRNKLQRILEIEKLKKVLVWHFCTTFYVSFKYKKSSKGRSKYYGIFTNLPVKNQIYRNEYTKISTFIHSLNLFFITVDFPQSNIFTKISDFYLFERNFLKEKVFRTNF